MCQVHGSSTFQLQLVNRDIQTHSEFLTSASRIFSSVAKATKELLFIAQAAALEISLNNSIKHENPLTAAFLIQLCISLINN